MSQGTREDERTEQTGDASGGSESGVDLLPDQLSSEALRGLIEEYVSREGTDYGPGEWSLEDKVEQVLAQIDRGEARIVFDLQQQSASIVPSERDKG
jgi:uncharacterized protein YheU (UPF0270 family)